MVRLTADLVQHAPHYLNPLKMRELLLRGTPSILQQYAQLGIEY